MQNVTPTERIIRALADPTRLRIMRLLARMELAVGELAQVLGQSQPRVSRHIAILVDSALIERRREGSWIFLRCALPEAGLLGATAQLLDTAEAHDLAFAQQCDQDRRHLAAIRQHREDHAAQYFAAHAKDWDRLRDMLTPADEVERALASALGDVPLGMLLDVGTGTGRSAEVLASHARHIVGLDRSPEMLRLARARLQHLPAASWELVQGDFAALPFAPAIFDTVLLHQVLHFAPDPSLPLAEAARVCREGGRIAIVDLAAHDREELRARHAHARLGFTDAQMHSWLEAHGFAPLEPLALHGHDLITKIWVARRLAAKPRLLSPRKEFSHGPV